MVDPAVIGTLLGPFPFDVGREQVRAFVEAIGDRNPVSNDLRAARDAGHPDLLAPPTFLFCLDLASGSAWELVDQLGFDRDNVLHGEQHFTYHRPVHAGDRLVLRTRVTDVVAKRNGALHLVDRTTDIRRSGRLVAELRSVIAVRTPEVAV